MSDSASVSYSSTTNEATQVESTQARAQSFAQRASSVPREAQLVTAVIDCVNSKKAYLSLDFIRASHALQPKSENKRMCFLLLLAERLPPRSETRRDEC